MNKKTIWITWEQHRRTREICSALDVPLFELCSDMERVLRVPYLCFQTLKILKHEKAEVVFAQCPSIFLATILIFLRHFFKFKLIIDQHNETIRPFNYSYKWYLSLCLFVIKKADLNIVTNETLENDVLAKGGMVTVLNDKIPHFSDVVANHSLGPGKHIVFICTYSPDEPFAEVFKAAELLPSEYIFHVTGNSKKIDGLYSALPPNIQLTGYLAEEDFLSLLSSCDAIIDLTYMDDCLVCGAYEAVGFEKPMILSGTEMLKKVFNKGAIYCQNNCYSIRDAVMDLFSKKEVLHDEVKRLKTEMSDTWLQQKVGLIEKVNTLTCSRSDKI